MPRGNDTEYAVDFDKKVMEQYGVHPNAQALIDAHRASRDPGVLRAGMTQMDPEATAEANDDLQATAAKFPDAQGDLVSTAVRGNAIIGVFLDPLTGAYSKQVAPWSDSYKPPVISQEAAEERAAYLREEHIRVETEKLRVDADQKIAEARAAEEARISEELQRITEEADTKLQDAKQQAMEDAKAARQEAEDQARQDAQDQADASAGAIPESPVIPPPPDRTGETPPLDLTQIGQVDPPPTGPSPPGSGPSDDDSAPETVDEGNGAEIKATSAAIQAAEDAGIDIATVEGTGKDGTITKADVDRAVAG